MDQLVRRQRTDSPAVETSPRCALVATVSGAAAGSDVPAVPAASAGLTVPAGRRRGKALEAAIFDAALDQLTSGGFARMTMEGIAGAAQTGKAALYRRWTSKADLVLDALAATLPPPTDIPDLGSVRSELLQLIERFGSVMESRVGAAMRALMAELDHERARVFMDFVLERVVRPSTLAALEILERGELRGDVRPGAANPLVADVAPAMLLYRAKVCEGSLDPGYSTALVDEVLIPMVRP